MKQRYRLRLTREAGDDLEAIHSYIAARSPANASRVIQRLLDSIQGLRIFPHHTMVADHPDGAIRSLAVPPHLPSSH